MAASDKLTTDSDFEEFVVASLISTKDLMESYCDVLKDEFITAGTAQHVWALARAYFIRYKKMPTKAVLLDKVALTYSGSTEKEKLQRETLQEAVTDMFSKEDVPVDYVRDRLSLFCRGKALQSATIETLDDLQAGKFTDKIVTRFRDALKVGEKKFDPGTSVLHGTRDAIEKECDPLWRPPVPTGLPHFDNELGGGLRPGEVGIIMAPPKGFKSGLLMNFAYKGVQRGINHNVLYVTLELSEHLQTIRLAQRVAMLGKHVMLSNPSGFVDLWRRRVTHIFAPGRTVYIKYFPPYAFTPLKLREYLDTMQKDYGVTFGLGCIDYLNLLGCDEADNVDISKDYLQKVKIITDVRSVATDYNMPIWTAARANRDEQNAKKPGMAHMGAAYEIVSVADTVYAHRRFPKQGTSHLIPVASRNEGGSNRVICRCDPSHMHITSIGVEPVGDDDDTEDADESGDKKYKKKRQPDEVEEMAKELRKMKKSS